ncbi:MAG: hypothetical protein GX456_05165, partial [Verrucomicrobia bacterium]|nr:hypothetical protein [Verrucomicrobiota bacterium]
MLVSKPPKGGTLTAADAVGVGRREAFGVRQLAAAFFLCSKNVSVPMPRHPQDRFRVFRVFRGYNQPNHRSLLPKSARFHDTIPPSPQTSPTDQTTA